MAAEHASVVPEEDDEPKPEEAKNNASAETPVPKTTKRAPASHRIHEPRSKPGDRPVRKKPSVRFDESAVNEYYKRKNNDPRKIYLGKVSKVRLCFYMSMPLVFLAFLLYATAGWGDTKKSQEKRVSIAELLQQTAQAAMSRRRTDPCALFLHTGSIPGTGWSLYAGQEYQKGDLILETSQVLSLDDSSILVPLHALLLKHHPTLANAEGPLYAATSPPDSVGEFFQLRATRFIAPGAEIFVPFDKLLHNNPHFDHIPMPNDYQLADEIISDMLTTSTSAISSSSNQKRKPLSSAHIFQLVQRSVAKLNPRVAALIPDNIQTAKDYDTNAPSYWAALKNRTLVSLQNAPAVCVSDIQQQQSSSNGRVWTTTRSVEKGNVLATVPIFVQPLCDSSNNKDDDATAEECRAPSSQLSHCFGLATVPILFCPLSMNVHYELSGGSLDEGAANVEYRWRNAKLPGLSLHKMSDLSKMIAWDLVALIDMQAGQEVRVK